MTASKCQHEGRGAFGVFAVQVGATAEQEPDSVLMTLLAGQMKRCCVTRCRMINWHAVLPQVAHHIDMAIFAGVVHCTAGTATS